MPLEQITTDYDMQEPTPKGMVRTEMGRLVKKSVQDAWDKSVANSLDEQAKGVKLASMKKQIKTPNKFVLKGKKLEEYSNKLKSAIKD
jgi:hypothetical protein